jgi:hypothetical protein
MEGEASVLHSRLRQNLSLTLFHGPGPGPESKPESESEIEEAMLGNQNPPFSHNYFFPKLDVVFLFPFYP